MTRIFFSDWELNVIQVGLNHVQDEFDFLTEKQKGLCGDIVMDLDRYRKRDKDSDSDKYGFKLTQKDAIAKTGAGRNSTRKVIKEYTEFLSNLKVTKETPTVHGLIKGDDLE